MIRVCVLWVRKESLRLVVRHANKILLPPKCKFVDCVLMRLLTRAFVSACRCIREIQEKKQVNLGNFGTKMLMCAHARVLWRWRGWESEKNKDRDGEGGRREGGKEGEEERDREQSLSPIKNDCHRIPSWRSSSLRLHELLYMLLHTEDLGQRALMLYLSLCVSMHAYVRVCILAFQCACRRGHEELGRKSMNACTVSCQSLCICIRPFAHRCAADR